VIIIVASVRVKEINGAAPGTFATITTARFATMDSNNPGISNPIPIPTTGVRRAYKKAFALAFAGTFTQINNVTIYTDGTDFGTGILTLIGSNVGAGCHVLGSYRAALGQLGVDGSLLTYARQAGSVITGTGSFFTYTSGAKKLVGSQIFAAAGTTRFVALQLKVGSNAVQGVLSSETITFTYDEI